MPRLWDAAGLVTFKALVEKLGAFPPAFVLADDVTKNYPKK